VATSGATGSDAQALVDLGDRLYWDDPEGARAAYQQAVDAGHAEWAGAAMVGLAGLLQRKLDDADAAEALYRQAIRALAHQMAIPVAYWTAGQCAVVLVLRFFAADGRRERPGPAAMQLTYERGATGWEPHRHAVGSGFSHDPIARPGDERDLGGRAMVVSGTSEASQVTPGHPAFIATGPAAPEVKYLAVTQVGREDRRRLDSHFGAWVVCTEQPGPFEVTGIGEDGTVLASLRYP
jgi:hypothetical protein